MAFSSAATVCVGLRSHRHSWSDRYLECEIKCKLKISWLILIWGLVGNQEKKRSREGGWKEEDQGGKDERGGKASIVGSSEQ